MYIYVQNIPWTHTHTTCACICTRMHTQNNLLRHKSLTSASWQGGTVAVYLTPTPMIGQMNFSGWSWTVSNSGITCNFTNVSMNATIILLSTYWRWISHMSTRCSLHRDKASATWNWPLNKWLITHEDLDFQDVVLMLCDTFTYWWDKTYT
jgi:hypothetical protein